jgi:hypothetical protein
MAEMAPKEIFRHTYVQPWIIFVKIIEPLMDMLADVYLKTENGDCLPKMHTDKKSDIESGMFTRNAQVKIEVRNV